MALWLAARCCRAVPPAYAKPGSGKRRAGNSAVCGLTCGLHAVAFVYLKARSRFKAFKAYLAPQVLRLMQPCCQRW